VFERGFEDERIYSWSVLSLFQIRWNIKRQLFFGEVFLLGMKRRNSFSITYDIVSACCKGPSKTQIVYVANLNSERVNGYLDACMNLGLICMEKNVDGHIIYKTTDNGLRFLESHANMLAKNGEIPKYAIKSLSYTTIHLSSVFLILNLIQDANNVFLI
jgi:predicted transcriptional regulator